MCITSERSRFGAVVFFAVTLLVMTTTVAGEIPVDARGLSMWQVKEWTDFPVSIELRGHEELDALLRAVPIVSFNREQISIIRKGAKRYHLDFHPRVTEAEFAALQRNGFRVTRLRDFEREGRQAAELQWGQQYAKGSDTFKFGEKGVWHTYAQVGNILGQIAMDHPSLARTFTWGTSVEGRDLWGLVISADVTRTAAEPEVRLSCTMHGNEPPGLEMLLFLADYLTDNYGQPGFADVTNLVDNYEIHIMPLHNPDGHVACRRYNANDIDLNRNFLEPAGTHESCEIENIAFMDYADSHHFVISENGHSGALLVNYPWDYTYTLAPDDAAIQLLSLEYSTWNLPMYNGDFTQGISNGAAWYLITGSLQDWSYDQTDCIDVTIEHSDIKWPDAGVIDGLWDENRESFMHFIKCARYGINGVVSGAVSGLPLSATVSVAGIDKVVHTDVSHGDYYKLLPTGTYDVTFAADGYITRTVHDVSTTWGTPAVVDVEMLPLGYGTIVGRVVDTYGDPVPASIEVRTYPGDVHVTVVQASAVDGLYSVSLAHGDYRMNVSNSGNMSQALIVTLDDDEVIVDFTLGIVQGVTLLDDDFEGGTDNWTGVWGLAVPADGCESSNSMTDSPGSDSMYANSADAICVMVSGVDLSTAVDAGLSFWAKWDIEPNWDCVKLEASIDDGTGWIAISTNRTGPGSGQGAQVPASDPVFDGEQTNWVDNTADLSSFLGQSDVRFRFRLMSNSSLTEDGFYFDDFIIQAMVETPDAPRVWLSAFPNPFNPMTNIEFSLVADGHARLEIFDIAGRRVDLLVDEQRGAGKHHVTWSALRHPSGVYFARLVADGRVATVRMALVR